MRHRKKKNMNEQQWMKWYRMENTISRLIAMELWFSSPTFTNTGMSSITPFSDTYNWNNPRFVAWKTRPPEKEEKIHYNGFETWYPQISERAKTQMSRSIVQCKIVKIFMLCTEYSKNTVLVRTITFASIVSNILLLIPLKLLYTK